MLPTINVNSAVLRRELWLQIYTSVLLSFMSFPIA